MRSPKQFTELVTGFAENDPRVRIMAMEGSRVNKNIPRDIFQDFDITFFVDDIESFKKDDKWLEFFGKIIMLQKPEDMELFPACEIGFSYLIMFDDYNKMDLTLLELSQLEDYLSGDSLREILFDKDGRVNRAVIATDKDYHIKMPSPRSFDDCCNEFWNITPYVVKGLCRKEILFAIDHLQLMRNELLRMISWNVGLEKGFNFSVGKNYKFLDKFVSRELWQELLSTYNQGSYECMWSSLFTCLELFRESSLKLAQALNYEYPRYDENITKYAEHFYGKYK